MFALIHQLRSRLPSRRRWRLTSKLTRSALEIAKKTSVATAHGQKATQLVQYPSGTVGIR